MKAFALSTQVRRPAAPARLAAACQPKREIEQPLRGLAGDHQGLARFGVGHHALAHGGEQALGRFADHDEIDAALGRSHNRARHVGDQPARPHAGVEVEDEAQLDLRHDLGIVGIADVRQSAGAEQDGVGLLAQLDGGRRHRLAGVAIMAGARRRLGEAEFQPRRRRRDLVEDGERGGHDFRPDAVAGQDRDVEAVVGEHDKMEAGYVRSVMPELDPGIDLLRKGF